MSDGLHRNRSVHRTIRLRRPSGKPRPAVKLGNDDLNMSAPVFRFAPSPNGYLHLGHALSALLDFEAARAAGVRFLLRMEDIDATRCRPEFEAAIIEDL